MSAIVKELKNGKWALIGDKEYVLEKASEKKPETPALVDDGLRAEIAELRALVEKLFEAIPRPKVADLTPKLQLTLNKPSIAPSKNVDELRAQIHQSVGVLARRLGIDKGFAWHEACILLFQKIGYDVKANGAAYIKGKGTTLINRVEQDEKLTDMLRVLRDHLYK